MSDSPSRAGWLNRTPLAISLPLFVALPAVILAIVLLLSWSSATDTSTRALAKQTLDQVHRSVHERLEALLQLPPQVAELNARALRDGSLSMTDLRSWQAHLFRQAQAFPELSCVEWGTPEGHVVWFIRVPDNGELEFGIKDAQTGADVHEYRFESDGSLAPDFKAMPYDPRGRPWYVAAVESDEPTWFPPYLWVNNDEDLHILGLGYTQQLKDDQGDLLGVLDVELTLEGLAQFLATLRVGEHGSVFVVDSDGHLLATSRPVELPRSAELPRAADLDAPWVATPVRALANAPVSADTLLETSLTIDDVPHLVRVSEFSQGAGLNWRIGTVVPEADFLGSVQELQQSTLLLSGVAIIGALAVGGFLGSRMSRPVMTLVDDAHAIGKGDLDRHVQLTGSPELLKLSDAFNDMTSGLRDRMRMRRSLALAMEVQECLLPDTAPQIDGLDIAGHSTYCDETGGDYYDYLDVSGLSDHVAAIAVGDVVGHGIAAAMLMASVRGVLRSRCEQAGSLADLLEHLNAHMSRDVGVATGRFMTMLLMTIDPQAQQLKWASAGHDPPLVFDPDLDDFIELHGSDLPLGIIPDGTYEEHEFSRLKPGQICFVGTDGVWEAANPDGTLYGKERLMHVLRETHERPSAEIAQKLRESLDAFRGSASQGDDVTFIVLKILPLDSV